MVEALREIQRQKSSPFTLEVVDIDADPMLEQRYGELVPVLLAGERRICHYHLDRDALDAYLAEFR
jgi:hypothetical protein